MTRKSRLTNSALILFFFIFSFLAKAATVTSIDDGNWSNGATWDSGSQPAPGDDVIINHNVTLDVTVPIVSAVGSVTINNNASSQFGSLTVGSNTISTTGDFKMLGFSAAWGSISVNGGILNAGGAFIFNKGLLVFTTCNINVGTYFNYIAGSLTASADVTFRVSTNGSRDDDVIPSIYVDQTAEFTLNAATVTFTLENLNTGSAKEIDFGSFSSTSTGPAKLECLLNNSVSVSNDICYVQSDVTIDNLDININKAPAENNSLQINRTDGQAFLIDDLELTATSMSSDALDIINSLLIDDLSDLNVNGFLNCSASDDLIVDGKLYVSSDLFLKSNIIGVGLVQAAAYDYDNDTYFIYGIRPLNGKKVAGSTWYGGSDANWFDDANWNDGKNNSTPQANSYVLISTDYISGTWPSISTTNARAAVVDLIGTAATLLVNTNGELQVKEKGGSGKDGRVLIGQGAGLNVLGGSMTVEIDMNIGGTLSVSSNGQVQVNGDVDVETGGNLNVASSSVNIGPVP